MGGDWGQGVARRARPDLDALDELAKDFQRSSPLVRVAGESGTEIRDATLVAIDEARMERHDSFVGRLCAFGGDLSSLSLEFKNAVANALNLAEPLRDRVDEPVKLGIDLAEAAPPPLHL